MQFKLRTVFVWIIVLAILLGTYAFVENTWFGPARQGVDAQAKFNRLIAENQWDGFIAPTHYLKNVRIGIYNVEEAEIRKLYPTLHEITWIESIVIHSPSLTPSMLQELANEFPECVIDVDSNAPRIILNK
jgi:hypothetical protein